VSDREKKQGEGRMDGVWVKVQNEGRKKRPFPYAIVFLMSHYLDGLNEKQRSAVEATEGALLILAGAGSGKTRVVTHRILHLIKKGVPPGEILAITFTNKAAKEMKERVRKLVAEDQTLNLPVSFNEMPWVGTFHALGVHILRRYSRTAGISQRFIILDRADALAAAKEALQAAGVDPKRFPPGKVLGAISRKKGDFMTQLTFAEKASSYSEKIIAAVWERYEKILVREQALDFDDLLLRTATLLSEQAAVLAECRERWRYIHVDEYQDTNEVQYRISKLLAGPAGNICVVGDVDQNIYSWRGANIENILTFERDFPNVREILLEENYRSTQTILHAANAVISKNRRRKEKNLFTRNAAGEKIALVVSYDETDEARFVAHKAGELLRSGVPAEEVAVLYRANFQSRILEEAFLAADVPYQVLGTRFFERKEVKDVLSFIAAAMHPESTGSLKRIVNIPPRGIGKVSFLKMISGNEGMLTGAAKRGALSLRILLTKIAEQISILPPSALLKFIITESGLEAHLERGSDEDRERLENIRELVTLATGYDALPGEEGIERLLEEAALRSDQDELDEGRSGVRLMTVHAAKGLEFAHVFVTGLEEGLFPHRRHGEAEDDNEEERRLFYVAITRAKKKAYLSYASVRTIYGSRQVNIPSEFITDIPDELFEAEEVLAGRTIYLE
jgi:DNA helicase-2/ATP-dependent DNA helicase PcrA